MRIPVFLALVLSLAWAFGAPPALAADGNVDLPRYPSISPDGKEIVFSWRGDLWKVGAKGGEAFRLTAHPRDEHRSAWSPDGKLIAFTSNRDGWENIYMMNADGSGVRQLTFEDTTLQLCGFSSGGEYILFSASMEGDVYRAPRPYRVRVAGGPVERVHDAFGNWPQLDDNNGGRGTERVVFVRGGSRWSRRHYLGPDDRDLWLYTPGAPPNAGFRQLTTWEGNDARPRFRNDKRVLFLADRTLDAVNLYEMDVERGEPSVRQLTSFRGTDVHEFDVSRDGRTAVMAVWDTLYTLDLGKRNVNPFPLTIDASQDEDDNFELMDMSREADEAALSPDGQVMAIVAHGDVYVRNIDEGQPTRRITTDPARERDIAWSPDGLTLYFSSDRDGGESIFAASVTLTRSEIKEALDPAAEEEEETDEAGDEGEEESEDAEAGDAEEGDNADGDDGDDDEDTDAEEDADEEKDDEDESNPADRWHDAVKFEITPVVQSEFNDRSPRPSPDGAKLAFRRTRGDTMILDLETGDISTFNTSWNFWSDWRWSPDSRHIAYSDMDENYNSEVWIAPIDGSTEPANVSKHPDNDYAPRWSADGKILAFLSERTNDDLDVWMVYLDRDLDALKGIELEKYYEDAAEAAKELEPLKPKDDEEGEDESDAADDADEDADEEDENEAEAPDPLDLDDAYLRLRRVTSFPGDESNLEMTPAGDRFVFTASGGAGGDGGLFSIKWDGDDKERLGGRADVQQLSLDGSKVVYVSSGRVSTVPVEGGDVEHVDISHSARIDLEARASQMFREAARVLGMTFYHPTMKGLDWAALSERYHELARRARTSSEFAYIGMRLVGELNASHLGIFPQSADNPNSQPNARLGIDSTPTTHNGARAYRVGRVIDRGPAAEGGMALREGDLITAVEFEPIDPVGSLNSALKGRAGQETIVTVVRSADAEGEPLPEPTEFHLLLTPISSGAERTLRYNDWQRHNADKVAEWSNGRLGYLHIRSMGGASLVEFERDLYAAGYGKDALLIDVRNNGGGWTADRVLAALSVTPHAYTTARGDTSGSTDGYPQDRLYIQRYTKPVNMLCNEKSFSNAEIVSHAFKTLGRGNLVGQQTYGGVISTGGWRLVDGTFVRQPFRGWYVVGGMDMENNGAIPDIIVPQTPEEESAERPYGQDAQLKAAVDDLLTRVR